MDNQTYTNTPETNNNAPASVPSSLGSWVVTVLLTMIPIVNIVMLFVWGFGNTQDISKKNWAKAQLIWILVGIVLYILVIVIAGASILSLLD